MTIATTQLPDDDRLKKLIASAHDDLPEPDSHRLMVVEQRLSEKIETRRAGKRSTRWIWLIAGLMLAGSATAAWWVSVSWRNETEQVSEPDRVPVPVPAEATSNNRDTGNVAVPESAEQVQAAGKDQRSRTIYRRDLR